MTQHLFFNQPKKCVNKILNNDFTPCTIDTDTIHSSFSERWSAGNDCIWPSYDHVDEGDQKLLDEAYDDWVSPQLIKNALTKINKDTAAGPDKILVRSLKSFSTYELLSIVFSIIIKRCVDAVLNDSKIQTNIYRGRCFPFQIGIGEIG